MTRDPRDTSQVEYVCDQSCVWGAAQLLLATSGLQTMLKILSTHHSLKVDKVKVDISIQSIFLPDETLIKHKHPCVLLVAPISPPVVCWPAISPFQSAIGVSANHKPQHNWRGNRRH